MVFVVVVVLMPLHHLRQPPLVKHQTRQIPHMFLLDQRPRGAQRAQGPVALALLGALLVLAIGGGGLMRGGLAGQGRRRRRRGRRHPPAPQDPAADLGGGGAAVRLGGAQGVPSRVLAPPGARDRLEAVGVDDSLQAAVVVMGMGVSVLRLMRPGAGLVGGAALRLGLGRLCGLSWEEDTDAFPGLGEQRQV